MNLMHPIEYFYDIVIIIKNHEVKSSDLPPLKLYYGNKVKQIDKIYK